jgi:drug/metabolite transporter (DMT)-like permease
MHGIALLLVLLSAIFHATWNAQLKGCEDRAQFLMNMCLVVGVLALLCVLFAGWPSGSATSRGSWGCVGLSAILHIAYNLLLLQNYRRSDLGSAYATARGVSPLLVTVGGFLLMQQRPSVSTVAGIAMISSGILFLSTEKAADGRRATLIALATGAVIGAYTVVDGIGVRHSQNTLSYTAWVFASYLLTPAVLRLMRMPVHTTTLRGLPQAAIAGVFSLAAYTLVLWATRYADIGIVSALRETSVLWAVVIGQRFLGETFTWRRIASASIICGGVILLVV